MARQRASLYDLVSELVAVKFSILNSLSNLALDLDVAEGLLAMPLLFFSFAWLAAEVVDEDEVDDAAAAAAGAAPAISRVLAKGDQV